MNLLEHEAKDLFRRYGISVPRGLVFDDLARMEDSIGHLGFPLMVKAQTTGGGRGKAGGVRTALTKKDALEFSSDMINVQVAGMKVHAILLEEMIDASREVYLAIAIDQKSRSPVLLAGSAGGIDVESMPDLTIRRWPLDPLSPCPNSVVEQAAHFLFREGPGASEVKATISSMWRLFREMDCELVEINPLMVTDAGKVIAVDAKVTMNDEALFRHPEFADRSTRELTELERMAKEKGFNLVELPGDIGVLANGAGLTMAALDTLQGMGGSGGTFLDLGGTDDPGRVSEALSLLLFDLARGRARSLLICIFGGITKCDTVADALISTIVGDEVKSRTVVRLRGNNEREAADMLRLARFNVKLDLDDACREAVRLRA